ncbi:hypothetical protein PR048_014971 [Dryococelus australis]|uniref:Uncharacterized protein n=1 Tax=Dryococelus australis TaxID=614101 RepID=A0ABQ9HG30_9NEOP|nr:hypothetical protein PR048_014971 [Dryococelus australis]
MSSLFIVILNPMKLPTEAGFQIVKYQCDNSEFDEDAAPAKAILSTSHQGDQCSIPVRVTPDIRMWESCRTMPLVGGFLLGSPVSPPFHSGTAPYSPQSPSSALKTSMLRAVQVSSLILLHRCQFHIEHTSQLVRTNTNSIESKGSWAVTLLASYQCEPVQSTAGSLRMFATRGRVDDAPSPFSPHFNLTGSQDLVIKSSPNLSTQLNSTQRKLFIQFLPYAATCYRKFTGDYVKGWPGEGGLLGGGKTQEVTAVVRARGARWQTPSVELGTRPVEWGPKLALLLVYKHIQAVVYVAKEPRCRMFETPDIQRNYYTCPQYVYLRKENKTAQATAERYLQGITHSINIISEPSKIIKDCFFFKLLRHNTYPDRSDPTTVDFIKLGYRLTTNKMTRLWCKPATGAAEMGSAIIDPLFLLTIEADVLRKISSEDLI